jgi:uncharacterized Ntn-hydrolase superfamily protein
MSRSHGALVAFIGLLGCFAALSGNESVPAVVEQAERGEEDVWCHTFSIVAYDPEKQEWGVGVASRVVAVGAVVPYAKAGVGAVATQSYANKSYGPNGLKLLAEGKTPEEVIKILTDADKMKESRQVGIIDAKGNTASFSGKGCNPYAGARAGKNYSCQGNLLAGEAVITDMGKAFEDARGPLTWRIMAALKAAENAGGDKRGKQSAAILIVRDNSGYFGGDDRFLDLRVDDHENPVDELARIVALRVKKPKE